MMKIAELSFSVLALSGFGFLFYLSLEMPRRNSFLTSAGAFPAVVCGVMFFFTVVWIIDLAVPLYKNRKTGESSEKREAVRGAFSLTTSRILRLAVIIITTLIYVYLLTPLLGFISATGVFLIVALLLFSESHWVKSILLSVSVSLSLYLVFSFILHLPTP